MRIKKIRKANNTVLSQNSQLTDFNIYIDTDSVFFSAEPILNHRWPEWKEWDDVKIAEKVNDIAGESQDYINKFYDILAKRFFNIDIHRLEIKKEFVSKRGIWLAKKRYAQWIISDNGVPVDRLDVKGLDVVRSSFPKAFRQFMSGILKDILEDKTEDYISIKVNKFKDELNQLNVVDIAKNSSVKNLTKYMPKKSQTMFTFKSGTPAHVKASIAFNQLLRHFKCTYKYAPLKDGDKVKWVYLRNNPFGLESMAFRGDDDPEEIMDIVKTYVDYDKIFERELQTKLQDFFTALGFGDAINTKSKAEEFFSF
jgi:DNA polymerase elongation subunit (family B)